ncbi:AAA-like domain-containing protein [Brasilonema sp. CT11]|nr:AAA-like domain-containing protein [Brasilonema sp. CT11]
MSNNKVLILAAIPDGLRLDREIRQIEEAIRRAINRDLFEIKIRTAVRPQDIRRAIAEEHPQIVHFCGHGMEDGSLVLEDDGGNHKPVSPTGLAALFKLHANVVKCVLLNACYSEKSAQAISQHINYTIGMNKPIGDRTAIVFAIGFYDGLGYENPDSQDIIERAFEEGLVAIQMEDVSQGQIPNLKKKLSWIENSSTEPDTSIYIERPPIEEKCYKAIVQPGALIRIKAPQRMGKTKLSEKLLDYARQKGYKTAKLDLNLADSSVLTNLKSFLQWLCINVSDILELEPKLENYWQDELGINTSCTRYFQKYLLPKVDTSLVFTIDNFERLFQCENIFSEFCLLLRSWYETAKQGDKMGKIWQKLRLVVVNSTEVYPTLDTNRSPFNVGLPIELPEFNLSQVEKMAQLYEVDIQLGEQGIIKLMTLLGGHPYLMQEAFANLKNQEMSLEELLTLAPTEEGIFSHHLREQLKCLQDDSQLELAYKEVAIALEPVQLNPEIMFKLHSLGLIKIIRNACVPSCDLYRQYFSARLG